MSAQWRDSRKRNATMQLVMFLVFLFMLALAAWVGHVRGMQQEVALDATVAMPGVHLSVPSKWNLNRPDDRRLVCMEVVPSDKPEMSRQILVDVFSTPKAARDLLAEWISASYTTPTSHVTVQYLPVDGAERPSTALARVIVSQRIGNTVREGTLLIACVRVGDEAAIVRVVDRVRRPRTDEELLRAVARSVRLPESQVRSNMPGRAVVQQGDCRPTRSIEKLGRDAQTVSKPCETPAAAGLTGTLPTIA